MIVALFLSFTLLLAVLALRLIRRSTYPGSKQDRAGLLLALSLSVFVYLYGAWIYLSAYAGYAFAFAAVITALAGFLRRGRIKRSVPARISLRLSLSALLLIMDVLHFTGTAGRTHDARLKFPLKRGRYFVLQGGKGLPANVFHYNARRAVYAMDIVKLDSWGRRCRKIFSNKLEDYFIFGDTVYSPCDGIVQRAISDNRDNIPPERERGPHNLNGVVIDGSEYTVFLGHLQQGKVFVSAGQSVTAGQPLGLAGNSGMSLEPHLHIQVHAKGTDGSLWYKQPQLFIRLDGKAYLLFEVIDAQD